jgi:hypothetical protein
MPDNTLLLLGLGLAAWTLFRNNQQETGEGDLIDASMLSQGTGATGKSLGSIPVVNSDVPINSTERSNGTNGAAPGFDFVAWLNNIGITTATAATGNGKAGKVVNEDLPNDKIGPDVPVSVSPFVQTPEYIRTTGELAGTAIRQFGLERDVDLLNDRIYVQEIQINDDDGTTRITGPLTGQESVQIVAGGANPGDPYYTTLDFLVAAKEQGYFGVPQLSGPEASARSNVFDVEANERYLESIEEPLTVTGGVPVHVSPKRSAFVIDRYDIDTAAEF